MLCEPANERGEHHGKQMRPTRPEERYAGRLTMFAGSRCGVNG